MAYFVLMFH